MNLNTRKIIDRSFTGMGFFSILLMGIVLLFLLAPIVSKGLGAYFFKATVEHRRFALHHFERGDRAKIEAEFAEVKAVQKPLWEMIDAFENGEKRLTRTQRSDLKKVEKALHELIGPNPNEELPILTRQQYGQTRWDRAQVKLHELLNEEAWVEDSNSKDGALVKSFVPRAPKFEGTPMAGFFDYAENNIEKMLNPKRTFYWQFVKDKSYDSHFFGGIGPEVMGTIYLTLGAMIFAVPIGVIAAIYLCEYAKPGKFINLLRTCISTLAGVPSIVFGLFGLAFFLNTLKVTDSKSVLAGSLTLSLMILPTIIRASEEAILAVPKAYKEAALGLGSGRWHTIMTVVLPAALPGILTGVVISMGRAAGETAPIIFTAAVSMGQSFPIFEAFQNPTLALPWSIYGTCAEHEAVEEIRHVQFGMVFTLVAIVLLLNLAAIIMRARIAKKLKG